MAVVSSLSAASHDICNLDPIYNENYTYSLPRQVLESFLSGKGFDYPHPYSEDELARLRTDIATLYETILSTHPVKEKQAVITAGAPGAGKTIKMRQDLDRKALEGKTFAYICPDDVCLQNQVKTYQEEINSGDRGKEARQAAYNKWRAGSNAATHIILANLIREQYAFYFGSTSSSPNTNRFFEFLKKQGYHIRLIHVTAPDEVRWRSIQKRDETFIQTTEEDVRQKGLLLPQRIMDTFLRYADEIEFYYRDDVDQNAQLAAIWIRKSDAPFQGTLQIVSPKDYEKIKAIHNTAVNVLEKPELQWDATVEKHSTSF